MADGSAAASISLRDKVSAEEWRARVELAALYRLSALQEWDDLIYTHISARVPGPDHHFLINPYGMQFEEITASSLIKVSLDGDILQDTAYDINPAGFVVHSAVHEARPDAMFVMHMHSDYGIAVSAQKEGLLPVSQHGMIVLGHLAYHDYEGIALEMEERERLGADLGDKKLMLLRNHGSLSVGAHASECYVGMYYLEKACKQQVLALSAGRENLLLASQESQDTVRRQTPNGVGGDPRPWAGCLRQLDRHLPGYDA